MHLYLSIVFWPNLYAQLFTVNCHFKQLASFLPSLLFYFTFILFILFSFYCLLLLFLAVLLYFSVVFVIITALFFCLRLHLAYLFSYFFPLFFFFPAREVVRKFLESCEKIPLGLGICGIYLKTV